MMYTLRRVWQRYRARNGIRLLVVLILGMASVQFYTRMRPSSVFLGMYRLSDDPTTPNLLVNVYAIVFMACGLALPLEQFSEYLCVPEYLVYIRQRRGLVHLLRYLTIVVVYCCLFTGVQVAVAWCLVPDRDTGVLLSSAICSAGMLLVLILLCNAAYLMGRGSWGYMLSTVLYALVLSINPVAHWFAHGTIVGVPAWVPVLVCLCALLCVVNLHLFNHLEIQ
ncbi:MAG: hypothetical protein SOI64_06850 [Bifidobacterium mongoliense]|uniref:hypothetical protein n=1 Tax=Bifidobacterium mongoliense TaxID=518643 RepID=UPI002F35381E